MPCLNFGGASELQGNGIGLWLAKVRHHEADQSGLPSAHSVFKEWRQI